MVGADEDGLNAGRTEFDAERGVGGGDGGAWGIAVLARYRAVVAGSEAAPALPDYLSERVFAGASVSTLEPTPEGVAGYERFLDAYRASLPGVEVIARGR